MVSGSGAAGGVSSPSLDIDNGLFSDDGAIFRADIQRKPAAAIANKTAASKIKIFGFIFVFKRLTPFDFQRV
jgi:hypothetical protein